MMQVFLYGTLLDPKLLSKLAGRPVALTPAKVKGWRRVTLRGGRYPTLRRARGEVQGALAVVDRLVLGRLAAYEGPQYRLKPVVAETSCGARLTRAWIAPGGTPRAWP